MRPGRLPAWLTNQQAYMAPLIYLMQYADLYR